MLTIMFMILLLMVLLSVAFITLFERKLLGYMQLRKGPNKNLFSGILQPMIDGLKLLMKEYSTGMIYNKWLYMIFPCFFFILSLMFWFMFDLYFMSLFNNTMLFFILLSGLGVYGLIGAGWSSNSKYSLLGSYRSVAQTVSYEVAMVFLLMVMVYFMKSIFFGNFKESIYIYSMKLFLYVYVFLLWLIIILAELNRSPFDFAESESELVSGYNIEYGSGMFVMLFLSEYSNIIFMSYLSMLMFFKCTMNVALLLMLILIIWVRGVLPRFRYDNLMYLNWKIFLPMMMLILINNFFFDILFF